MTTLTITECCTPVTSTGFTEEHAENLARVLKTIVDPAGLKILNVIRTSESTEACVCEITAALNLSQPTISYHLKKVLEIGLLTKEKRAGRNWYSINDKQLAGLQEITASF